jgi:PAS domain S-box-containing protein
LEEIHQLQTKRKQTPTIDHCLENINSDNILKDSHLKYKIIADFTCDIEVCRDKTGGVVYISPAFEQITGYLCSDYVSGKIKPLDIVHPDDKHIFEKYLSKILTNEDMVNLEYRCLTKKGDIIYLQLNSQPIVDSDGLFLGRRTSIRDITRRKKMEQELIRSNEKYSNLVNNIGVGILVIDRSYQIHYSNPQILEWFPYIKNMKNPSCKLLFENRAENNVCEKCPTKQVFADGTVHQSFLTVEKDSSVRSYKVISTPLKDDEGNITSTVEIIEDITLEKQHENEIISSKNQLQEVIDNISELIIGFNLDKKVYMCNRKTEILSGCKKSSMVGRHVRNISFFENSALLEEALERIQAGKPIPKENLILVSKSGKRRIIKPTFSQVKEEELKGILLFGKDITEETEKRQLIPGRTYLIIDQKNEFAFNMLHQLSKDADKILIITRFEPDNIFSEYPQENIEIIQLLHDFSQIESNEQQLNNLLEKITKFSTSVKSGFILFDRLDYLIYRFSFDQALHFIYNINDVISRSPVNLFIRLNPLIFTDKELAAFKEECTLLPSQDIKQVAIEEPLHKILQYLYVNQQLNSVVTFKNIKDEFSIVDVTVQKRLYTLQEKNLIQIKRKGRTKIVTLSEKGRQLILKRQHR